MRARLLISGLLLLSISHILNAQADTLQGIKKDISGFVRTGAYGNLHKGSETFLPTVFSDLGVRAVAGNGSTFRAVGDFRFRYGTEFSETVSGAEVREAYVSLNGSRWDFSAGQKIIKWGRADFTNPTSKFNPINTVCRSLDNEDLDLGNIAAQVRIYPANAFSVEFVAVPFYRSSELITKPLKLPSYVNIREIDSLVTGNDYVSLGIKGTLHFGGIDMSLSCFNGYDPMPGTRLRNFSLDLSGPLPVAKIDLEMTPYRIWNLGADFETAAGSVGLRGEAAFSIPYKSWKDFEYVPLKELKWAGGADWSSGNFSITAEYSGKCIPGFVPPAAGSVIGTDIDMGALAAMMAVPGFDINEFIKEEVSAFNRLYNYQAKQYYHSISAKLQEELFYGRATPSLFVQYNFTSRDLILMPQVVMKPFDGISVTIGADIYSGRKGSLFDMVDDVLDCVKAGVRVDF